MTTNVTDALANTIRRIDGNNTMSATDLGHAIAGYLIVADHMRSVSEVVAFVERTNADKRMGAGALAELIVAEFGLDREG